MLKLSACAANHRVFYTTSAELLVDDEAGFEQVERKQASRSGLMQTLMLLPYNEQRSSTITSNIPWETWSKYLDDHLGATASTNCCTEATSS